MTDEEVAAFEVQIVLMVDSEDPGEWVEYGRLWSEFKITRAQLSQWVRDKFVRRQIGSEVKYSLLDVLRARAGKLRRRA